MSVVRRDSMNIELMFLHNLPRPLGVQPSLPTLPCPPKRPLAGLLEVRPESPAPPARRALSDSSPGVCDVWASLPARLLRRTRVSAYKYCRSFISQMRTCCCSSTDMAYRVRLLVVTPQHIDECIIILFCAAFKSRCYCRYKPAIKHGHGFGTGQGLDSPTL